MLAEEKLDEIGTEFEYCSQKSLRYLAQETSVLESSPQDAIQLLKLKPFKMMMMTTTIIMYEL